eukprot:CAMPEP_0174850366 /NCGR_PEP_ID=MMETSP1114-20130205/19188_1 /TAXON_ID=312471 /ORGANISM="Neobodo designis, Strain CCAP 1951/1" /LENGTH=655 /DNA_ID=CAMNT_0016084823 /DNA_START=105 /DNA_END=2072 /DNA_ORIENTATION=-
MSSRSATHAAMFTHAHVFVRLHSRMQDGDHVAVMTVDPSGEAILVTVMARDCKTYESRLDAEEMKSIKDSVHPSVEISWAAYFDLIQRCFVDRALELSESTMQLKLTLKHDRQSDLLPAAAFTTTIAFPVQLASPQEGAISKTVNSMVAYLSLRTGDRREAEKIDELVRLDDQLKEDAAQITVEAATLRDEIKVFRQQAQAAESQISELQQLLSSSNSAEVSGGWQEALAKADLTRLSCRVPTAWTDRPLVHHNVRLLKSVKVKWPFTTIITKGTPALSPASPAEMDPMKPAVEDSTDMALSVNQRPVRGEHLRYCNVVPADQDSTLPALSKDEDDVFLELGQMDDWNFSVHEFDNLCRKASPKSTGALYYLGYAVFMRLGLCARFNMSESALLEWLAAVEAGYRAVPFHNALHAADALHCVYYVLSQGEATKKVKFTDLQILAIVIAAILVDFDHPGSGITNDYLRKAQPCYASLMYPGQAVLESHHVAAGFELMKLPRFNFLECLAATTRAELQSTCAQLVLSTDLNRHDAVMGVANKAAQAADFGTQKGDAAVLLSLILKAADTGFAAKSTSVYSFWVHRMLKELAALADLETKASLPVTGIASNASSERKSAMQLNHLNFIVLPTYACLSDLVPRMRVTGEFIRANKNFWA